jgi:hypothetical protein
MKINRRERKAGGRTHEGAKAAALTDEQRLRRCGTPI